MYTFIFVRLCVDVGHERHNKKRTVVKTVPNIVITDVVKALVLSELELAVTGGFVRV